MLSRSAGTPAEQAPRPITNRKLVRNAQVELEIISFDETVQKITALATEMRGYVATSSSQKQANGKLRGEVVVKVLPETLDAFLSKLRGLGELKNQTLGTEDVTKQYFDTDSRLKNARVMETRLIDILKTKSNKVADLLEVEKELGRVRASIEQMQGELKYMDSAGRVRHGHDHAHGKGHGHARGVPLETPRPARAFLDRTWRKPLRK